MKDLDKLILIDGYSLLNRAFYAIGQFATKDGQPTNAIFGFVKFLFRILEDEKPKYLAVALDVHEPTFRHKLYSDYKGTRKPMPPELVCQSPVLKQLLSAMNICTVELPGYEADDIIGTLSRKFDGVETLIYTGDRDAYQLVKENVTVCFTKRGVSDTDRLTIENFYQKVGLTPDQIIEEKSLMGDSSDNIPGVSGVGPKTALTLLQKYGTLDGVYEHIDEQASGLQKKLLASKEAAYLSHTLATIDTDVPISISLEDCTVTLPFSAKARAAFDRLEFFSLTNSKLFEEYAPTQIRTVTCKNVEDFLPVFRQCDLFSLCILPDGVHIAIDTTEYRFPMRQTLFDDGFFADQLKQLFETVFTSDKRAVLFDSKALSHRLDDFGIKISCPFNDVSLLGYLANSNHRTADIDEYVREFALPAENTAYALFRAYQEEKSRLGKEEYQLYEQVELPLSNVLLDMERTGVCVDEKKFPEFSEKYRLELEALSQKIYELAGGQFNLNSPFQLSEVLFERLGYPTMGAKKNIRGGYSTNADILEKLAERYEIVRHILRYRELQKLQSTYIDGIRPLVIGGIVHTTYNQTMATTGRLSSANPNLQNIPVRKTEGRELRKLFVAREGNVLVDADYSQIELRLLAHFSGCKQLQEAYCEGKDIHAITASQVFGVPLSEVTGDLRRRAKAVNFGIIYGISAFGLAKDLGCGNAEAQDYIDKYFATYSSVKDYMDENVRRAKEDGFVTTILGRKRYIPELKSSNYNIRSFGERAAMNMPLQGSSADIIKLAMLGVFNRLQKERLRGKIVLQVHDELILDVPKEEAEETAALLKEEMERAISLNVPLTADVSMGKSWYDAK